MTEEETGNRVENLVNTERYTTIFDKKLGESLRDVGDITHYAPWGNLAICYRDFGFAKGLVELGHVDAGIEKLASQHGEFAVRIE